METFSIVRQLRNVPRLNQDKHQQLQQHPAVALSFETQLEELKHFETLLDNQKLASTDAYNDSFVDMASSRPLKRDMAFAGRCGRNRSALPGAAKTYT